jgi:hypothetical protein
VRGNFFLKDFESMIFLSLENNFANVSGNLKKNLVGAKIFTPHLFSFQLDSKTRFVISHTVRPWCQI